MSKINISQFGGIAPRIPPRYLADHQAQTAVNCPTWTGSLSPMRGTTKVLDFAKSGDITSIYRFGQDVYNTSQYWFHWTADVDVVRGFIHGDTTERTFYTGDGAPKVTDNTLALTGATAEYPLSSYMLGVVQPTAALTAIAQGTPDTGATTETRVYVFTVVNSWGEESAPSPVTGASTVDVETGETVQITFPTIDSGSYDPEYRRLYRSVDGVYLLVYVDIGGGTMSADIPVATSVVVDAAAPDELGEELPSLTWLPPSSSLAGLTGMPNGVLVGFDGITVNFCEPYRPFAWPVQYQQSVGYTIVGLGVVDTTVAVLTVGRPFFIQGSHPDSMVVVEADISQACVSKKSIVSLGGAVYYASPDGLVALAPGGSSIVTEGRFDREQWQAYFTPSSIIAYAYERMYVAFYDTGEVQGGFVFDPRTGEFTIHNISAAGGYTDLIHDQLFLAIGTELHTWDTGAALTYTWKSKKFTMPTFTHFTHFRVLAESYPVTLSLYMDGVLHHTKSVTSKDPFPLPAGGGRDFELHLTGTSEVYSVQIATSVAELLNG